jgi:hypothetical protein
VQPELPFRKAERSGKGSPVVARLDREQLQLRSVIPDRRIVLLEHRAIVADPEDVLERFEREAPAARQASWPAVIGGDGAILAPELPDHLGQVLHAGFEVRRDTELAVCPRHDLEVPSSAGYRREPGIAARFIEADGARQIDVDAILGRVPADIVLDDHQLSVHPEEHG